MRHDINLQLVPETLLLLPNCKISGINCKYGRIGQASLLEFMKENGSRGQMIEAIKKIVFEVVPIYMFVRDCGIC